MSKPTGNSSQDECEIAAGVYVKSKKKLEVEDVTMQEWISANARILLEIVDEMDIEDIKGYLKYTVKIGEFFQTCEIRSVMSFDNSHRKAVAQEGKQWNQIDDDTRFFYLNKRTPSYKQNIRPSAFSTSAINTRQPTDSSGQIICKNYNNVAGCKYSDCRFSHVCLASGCLGNHPEFQHNQAPRFRDFRARQH